MNSNSSFNFSLFLLIALASVVGCDQSPAVPTDFETWTTQGGSIEIDYPTSWTASGGWRRDESTRALFENGDLSVRVFARLTVGETDADSRLAEAENNADSSKKNEDETQSENAAEPESEMTLETFNDQNRELFSQLYTDYQEAESTTMDVKDGTALASEFTASLQGKTVNGIRIVMFNEDRNLYFRATAPKGQWNTFKPVFIKMLESIRQVEPGEAPTSKRSETMGTAGARDNNSSGSR